MPGVHIGSRVIAFDRAKSQRQVHQVNGARHAKMAFIQAIVDQSASSKRKLGLLTDKSMTCCGNFVTKLI